MARKASLYQTNFSQGEVSSYIESRPDVGKRFNAVRVEENFWGLPEGGVSRRPGTVYMGEVADSTKFTRALLFEYSTFDAFAIEASNLKFRFFKNRAQIMNGGVPYEIASPYTEADLRDIHHEQSFDFLFLTSLNPAVDIQKLARIADDNWTVGNFNANPPPSFEADENLGVIGAPNANTGTDIKFRVGTDQFLAGDVGRQIVAGTGRGTITAQTARELTVDVLDPFAATITASGKTLTSSGVNVTSTAHGRSAGEFVILTAGAQSGEIRQIISVTNANVFVIDDNFTVNQSPAVAYSWTAGFASGAWFLRLSPQTALQVNKKEPIGAQVNIGAGDPAFRASYVGKFLKLYGGLVKITEFTNSSTMKGVILSVLNDSTTADPPAAPAGSWRLQEASWSVSRGSPRTVSIHAGRLDFGGTLTQPNTFWGSSIHDVLNFAVGSLADSAYEYTLGGGQANPIQWLRSLTSLYIGTAKQEHFARGQGVDKPLGGDEIPYTAKISENGSMHVQPIVVDNAILMLQRFEQDVIVLAYSLDHSPDSSSFVGSEPNLFSRQIGNMKFAVHPPAYAQKPFSMVFWLLTNGQLAGLTFKPRQEIQAWSRTKTRQGDEIESVAVVPHESGQRLTIYQIVKRTINGAVKRYWEYYEDDYVNTDRVDPDTNLAGRFIIPAATSGTGINFQLGGTGFTWEARHVGMIIANLAGTGRARITAISTLSVVVCDILTAFPSVAPIAPGSWKLYLAPLVDRGWGSLQTDCAKIGKILAGETSITGVNHLANETVDVIIGNTNIGQKTVSAGGVVTLDATEAPNADTVYEVGLHYDSTLTTLRPAIPGEVTEGLKRSWPIVFVRVENTIGGKINGKPLKRQEGGARMYTGLLKFENLETADPYDGALTITADQPYPCTVLGLSGTVAFGDAMT
jgi:hypothetical protein